MADVIFRLGPNNLREERIQDFNGVAHKTQENSGYQFAYVIPISLRSFSVRVRNIRRSMSCSSSKERYLENPICSRNSAKSCRHGNTEVITGQRSRGKVRRNADRPLAQCRTAGVKQAIAARSSPGRHCEQRCRRHGDSCSSSGGL